MNHGISGAPVPAHLPYASDIQAACTAHNVAPCLLYGIAWRETISGEKAGLWNASIIMSADGGHGLFQLTSSWPSNWERPDKNAEWAIEHFVQPALDRGVSGGLQGDGLIRFVAAAFNSGIDTAWRYHLRGNVDIGTTGHDYASSVLENFHRLTEGKDPV